MNAQESPRSTPAEASSSGRGETPETDIPEEFRSILGISSCSWVSPQILHTRTRIEPGLFTTIKRIFRRSLAKAPEGDTPNDALYQIDIPEEEERFCGPAGTAEAPHIYLHTAVLERAKVPFPFTGFEQEVLRAFNVAPSQLHPNA